MKKFYLIAITALAVVLLSTLAKSSVHSFESFGQDQIDVLQQEQVPTAKQRNRSRTERRNSRTPTTLQMPVEPDHDRYLNIPYATIEGVDPNLLSLDLYVPKERNGATAQRPVLIMIHGGGWRNGDKANEPVVGSKMRYFVNAGYIYVSINYRLSPQQPGEAGVQHPIHAQDCAQAIAWVHDHIAQYGGNPDRIHLMGHSAGGHLAGLLGTNERFLAAVGKDLSILASNVLLDPVGLDIPRFMADLPRQSMRRQLYELIFSRDEGNWRDASPQYHVEPGKGIPPTLIFYAGGMQARGAIATALADSLTAARSPSRAIDTETLDHGQINSHVGMIGDRMIRLITRLHGGENVSRLSPRLSDVSLDDDSRSQTVEDVQSQAGADTQPEEGSMAQSAAARAIKTAATTALRFDRSYVPGTYDINGRFMGGTETMRLVKHNGMLFAGIGYWTDQAGDDPQPGGQILVKRGPDMPWQVDNDFPGSVRVNSMESITFTTDYTGNVLSEPVTLLLADAGRIRSRNRGPLAVWVRDDSSDSWEASQVTDQANRAFVRAFGMHCDRKTRIDHVFAGTGAGEIYAGAYDPNAPGKIRWKSVPEYSNPAFNGDAFKRVSAFTEANGKLFSSVAPYLVQRTDGPNPEWQEVFQWDVDLTQAGTGLRGITALPSLDSDHDVIVGSNQQAGKIMRIDPNNDFNVDVELDPRNFLRQSWEEEVRAGKLTAYNRLIPGTHPATGNPIHWVSIAATRPSEPNAAWILVRNADATYEVLRIFDPNIPNPRPLISTRTLEVSPWSDNEIYVGGYDGAANRRKNHNTAWIYKGSLD